MKIASGIALFVLLTASFIACGFKRQLVSIDIIPSGATITGAGVEVDFKAIGHYIHPPDSHDITNSVTWASAAPQIVSIDPHTGIATSSDACGTNITITATAFSDPQSHSGNVVIGQAPVTVTQPGPGCP